MRGPVEVSMTLGFLTLETKSDGWVWNAHSAVLCIDNENIYQYP